VAAARVCVLSMSELEMVDVAVGMGCELTVISLTLLRSSKLLSFPSFQRHYKRQDGIIFHTIAL
jgi:hypothetical protein